ncbi:MAG TPA: hypothetical protein VH417_06055 [Vicinamibacterales bacterium]
MSSSTRATVATALAILCLGRSASAQDLNFWEFLPAGQVVTPCAESSDAVERAGERLQQLGRRIEALDNGEPVASTVAALHDLLKSNCFAAAAETTRVPNPDSVMSLKEWWTGGGEDWLGSFLGLPRYGPIEDLVPNVIVPPDARKTLTLEGHGDHPLKALLCSVADKACGSETRGWQVRAADYFERRTFTGSDRRPSVTERPATGPNATSQSCAEQASEAMPQERYQRWRNCVEAARPRRSALPLGSFKAPDRGWLVVAGRRGHYEFCDTTRAFDLQTGAAFIYESCSALVLLPDGQVDRQATNLRRVEHVSAGTVSTANLREAVWMLLLRGEAEEVQVRAEAFPLPPGLTPRFTTPVEDASWQGVGAWFNTGQTSLTWRWAPEDAAPALIGELTWPDSDDAAESHAAFLLDVTEEGMVAGCASRRTPPPIARREPRQLNELRSEAIAALENDFATAAAKWKSLPRCGSGRR